MLARTRLVGRAPEIARLDAERRRTASGAFGCFALLGDAGVGKSRLASEHLRRCGKGVTGLVARGYRLGSTVPLGVWAEAFESHLRTLRPAEVERLCGGFLEDLAALLHSVASVKGWAPQADPPSARLLQGMAVLLSNIAARTPAAVLLDDMHLADASSWEALHYLARNLPHTRVSVVMTARTADLDAHPVGRDIVAGLEKDGICRRLDLQPLDQGSLGELAENVLGEQPSERLVAWLAQRSLGNPLFAISLLEALLEQGADLSSPELTTLPQALAQAVEAQLHGLDEPAISTLEMLSVVGQRVEFGDLVRLSGRPVDRLAPILHRLVTARLVSEEERGRSLTYEVVHPLIQETILHRVGGARRRSLHRLVGRALLAAGRLGAAAPHFASSAGEGDSEAISALRDAVRQAEERGAYREALTVLNTLVALVPDGDERWNDIFDALSYEAEWVVDHRADAHAILGVDGMRAIDRALPASVDPGRRAAVKFRLASFLAWGTGDLDEAERACRAAHTLFEDAGDRRSVLLAANELAWINALRGDFPAAETAAGRVLAEATATGDGEVLAQAAAAIGYAALARGAFGRAEEIFGQGVAAARQKQDDYKLTLSLSALGLVLGFEGRVDESRRLLAEGRSACLTYRDSVLLEWTTIVEWFAGDFRASVGTAADALASAAGLVGRRRGLAMPFAALSAVEIGSFADAHHYLSKARATYGERKWAFFEDVCSWGEAILLRSERRWGESVDLLGKAAASVLSMGALPSAALILVDFAETAHLVGNAAKARYAATALGDVAAGIDLGLYRGLAHLADASALLAEDRSAEAAQAARAAVDVLGSTGCRGFLARAHHLLGTSLAPLDRAEAVPAFEQAAALFEACGAGLRRDRTVHALGELGSQGRRAARSVLGAASLTAREREVVRMAAAGLTAKQIAERLTIGSRTVETHLSNAYAKLGVESRVQLLRKLAEARL